MGMGMGRQRDRSCRYCGEPIDEGQEFAYRVEVEDFQERFAPLDLVETSEDYHGEPLRTCRGCRLSVEENLRDIEEREARGRASAARLRLALKAFGILLLLGLIACVLADLRR